MAARSYLDSEAVYHQRFAENCIEYPGDRCFKDGLGPKVFDCSGFVLRAYCDVVGDDILQFTDVRNVRDMWAAAHKEKYPFMLGDFAVGSLIVTRRTYTINNERVTIPGHVGIITDAETPRFIHASARSGKVEERSLRSLKTMLGCIAISDLEQA